MKVYLAGPDVFRPDAVEHGRKMMDLCAQFGLIGLYPLDNCLPEYLEGEEAAQWICDANMAMIREADMIIANLQPFRGHELDSGTVFEMGLAVALGKPVIAHFPDAGDLRQQVKPDANGLCPDGYLVEDFGLPRNLMLACNWAGQTNDFQAAVEMAASYELVSSPTMRMG